MVHGTDNMTHDSFYNILKAKVHVVVMQTYDLTETFPKREIYSSADQLRRAIVSIMLNLIEGHARFKPKVKLQFFEISYGSLQESKYLIYLAKERHWISEEEYIKVFTSLDEIGAMIWSIINGMKKTLDNDS